jgi:hypothetical protein
MTLPDLCGCLQVLVVAVAVGRGALLLLGVLLSLRRAGTGPAGRRRAGADAPRRETEWAVAGLPDYPSPPGPPGHEPPPKPLTVEELHHIASEGLGERRRARFDGEGKIR